MLIEKSIFDRFSKVEFSDGALGKIYYKNFQQKVNYMLIEKMI